MRSDTISQRFLTYFVRHDHHIRESAPLVPHDDPSLLWINSGVAALKHYFDGRETPSHPRIVGVQKSLRTNDIEQVGFTARHHTFFEMLGNFSIGDYFKEEAIAWAWELLTSSRGFGLSDKKLFITVHPKDDEAHTLWKKMGVPESRIRRLEDNFWDLGVGPSGPNTEIFYDRGPAWGDADGPGGEDERYLEIWNLVFSEYNHLPSGRYEPLPRKNIDTGMGLERMAMVLQDVPTTYETDRFAPIIAEIARRAQVVYGEKELSDRMMRMVADHVRTLVVTLAEGVLPSAEGRGYVLRRLLRRAARAGHALGLEQSFLHHLVPTVVETLRHAYPALVEKATGVGETLAGEEDRFRKTLQSGLERLASLIKNLRAKKQPILSGPDAFRLYDTYGLPLDVTRDVLQEQNLRVDEAGFEEAMKQQQTRARAAHGNKVTGGMRLQTFVLSPKEGSLLPVGRFVGYNALHHSARVVAAMHEQQPVQSIAAGGQGVVLLDATPFYAEGGGQVCDEGTLTGEDCKAQVLRIVRGERGEYQHYIEVTEGTLTTGAVVQASVSAQRRRDVARNHTATHLLHQALRATLGHHATQSGSFVGPEGLRFDFPHTKALGPEDLRQLEQAVNAAIDADLPVQTFHASLEEAKRYGAMALFGEAYGEKVRVVQIGNDNLELCGGTHVERTASLGAFMILHESSVGAGTRRIEAVTGRGARAHFLRLRDEVDQVGEALQARPGELTRAVATWKSRSKAMEAELERMRLHFLEQQLVPSLQAEMVTVGEVPLLATQVKDASYGQQLLPLLDRLRPLVGGVILLGSVVKGRVQLVASVEPCWVERGLSAAQLINVVAKECGGSGGGKPDLARAGGKDAEKLPAALAAAGPWLAAQQKGDSFRG